MQRLAWWWPVALAVFVLSAWAAIVLGAGTAYADDGTSSAAGESQPEKSSETSSASDDKSTPKPPAEEVSKASVALEAADASDGPGTESPSRPSDVPKDRSIVRHTATVVTKTVVTKGDVPKGDVPADEPSSTSRSNVHDLTPRLAAQQTQPTSANSNAVTSNVVSLPTNAVASTAIGAAPTQRFEQLVRQVIGLLSDAGIVGASLVNNVAVEAAAAIGPQPFWGVPYTVATAIADTAANASKLLSGTPLDATSTGPFKVNYGVLDVLSFFTPSKVPAGANDPSITVTAAHPLPVILVNGTVETQSLNWSVGAPVLANAGYKVYTFNYGNITADPNYPIQSTADIRQSAVELSDEVDRVLAETGAAKVILVGHSQGGGILPVYYLNELGGAAKVSQLIGLAPSNHGTDFNGLVALQMLPILGPLLFAAADLVGPALGQQAVTSPFQQVVYGNGDTRPGVLYTTIASTNDEVVTPYTQQALNGPAVTNIVLQDQYPGLPTGHVGVAFSSQAWASVLAALAANPQANPLPVKELTAA